MSDLPPILFMAFNRPDTTAKVFQAIRESRPTKLYIALDGSRNHQETIKCAQVREIVENIDWECEVKRLYHNENLGCGKAVSSAITWFFNHEEEGIILEDDCLPDSSFFPYCQMMLEKYRNEGRVMMVSGDDFTSGIHHNDDYYFITHFPIWGWATWRRAWDKHDVSMSAWPEFRDQGRTLKIVQHEAMAGWLNTCFEQTYQGKIDTWDHQWTFTCLLNNGLSICPHGNLISNIGFDGTHMTKKRIGHLMNIPRVSFNISSVRHPQAITPDIPAQNTIYDAVLKDADIMGWTNQVY
ncbi:MAG: glycosyltransferase family 2 protein [Euryarchaeota archaeon]|nr:glycosyltransferase family 2 protein [Euryarchaeota archaeon]